MGEETKELAEKGAWLLEQERPGFYRYHRWVRAAGIALQKRRRTILREEERPRVQLAPRVPEIQCLERGNL
jgi:hypothetical protein